MQICRETIHRVLRDGYDFLESSAEIANAVAATYQAGYDFFRAPLAEKTSNTLSEDCGFRITGIEYSQSAERPDQVESFSATARDSDLSKLETEKGRFLYQCMRETIDLLEPVAETLAIMFAEEADQGADTARLRGAFRDWSCLQLNYSRPSACSAGMINEAHEDGHLLTLASADGPGLEIQTTEGGFVPANVGATSLLIMPGEIAWLLSGGLIRPLYHQVRPERHLHERIALLYFGDVNPDACSPWVKNKVNEGVDIVERIKENSSRFGLIGFEQQDDM
jgi:isopenicillin N synthase-like dioxygenase